MCGVCVCVTVEWVHVCAWIPVYVHAGAGMSAYLRGVSISSPSYITTCALDGNCVFVWICEGESRAARSAPIQVKSYASGSLPARSQPIPPHITKHPLFTSRLRELERDTNWYVLSTSSHAQVRNIRSAAKYVRDHIAVMSNDSDKLVRESTLINSLSTCLAYQDIRLANKLISASSQARRFLLIVNGSISLQHAEEFEKWADETFRAVFDVRLQGAHRLTSTRKRRDKLKRMRELSKIWCSFGKSIPIVSVLKPDGRAVTDTNEMGEELERFWGAEFDHHFGVHDTQARLLKECTPPIDLSSCEALSFLQFRKLISKLVDSGTGPAGLTYSCFCTDQGAWVLYKLYLDAIEGGPLPSCIVHSLIAFVAKKLGAADMFGASREPSATRPILLRTAAARILAAAVNESISPQLTVQLHHSQRGCVRGRNFLENVIELDGTARMLSRRSPRRVIWQINGQSYADSEAAEIIQAFIKSGCNVEDIVLCDGSVTFHLCELPCLLLFDFKSAFVKVCHAWQKMTLKWAKPPEGMMNIINCLSHGSRAVKHIRDREGLHVNCLFWFLRGLAQGCPLSGSMFDLSLHGLGAYSGAL